MQPTSRTTPMETIVQILESSHNEPFGESDVALGFMTLCYHASRFHEN